MTTETDKQVASILEKLNGALDAIAAGAAEHGDLAVDIAITVVRVEAFDTIAKGFAGIALFCFSAVLFWKFAAPWVRHGVNIGPDDVTALFGGAGFGVGALFFGVMGLLFAPNLFSVWAWVGIFEPKLYIAKRILDKVL